MKNFTHIVLTFGLREIPEIHIVDLTQTYVNRNPVLPCVNTVTLAQPTNYFWIFNAASHCLHIVRNIIILIWKQFEFQLYCIQVNVQYQLPILFMLTVRLSWPANFNLVVITINSIFNCQHWLLSNIIYAERRNATLFAPGFGSLLLIGNFKIIRNFRSTKILHFF